MVNRNTNTFAFTQNENIRLKFSSMKKKLTLLILLLPFVLFAQTQYKDGTITIDFGKKNKQQQDSINKEQNVYPSDDEEEAPKPKKEKKKPAANEQEEIPDFKRDGLFKGLFNVGLNATQVDGDIHAGYKYLGANVGVGAMVRYHKNLSTSIEIAYSMRGARAQFARGGATPNFFRTNFDYVEIPISLLNIHDKKLVMFSLGITPALLVRYKEWDSQTGFEVSNNPPFGQPRKFDLSVFGGFYFVLKQHYVLGAKFSYSVISMRGAEPNSRVSGQYHNMLTFRFMYIMDKASFKKK